MLVADQGHGIGFVDAAKRNRLRPAEAVEDNIAEMEEGVEEGGGGLERTRSSLTGVGVVASTDKICWASNHARRTKRRGAIIERETLIQYIRKRPK